MNITVIPADVAIGSDGQGRPYGSVHPNNDPRADTAQERLILSYGMNENDELVVRSLRRDGTAIKAALEGAIMAGLSLDAYNAMSEAATRPNRAEIHGMAFEIGGPAEGTVVDPEIAAANRDLFGGASINLQIKALDPFVDSDPFRERDMENECS